MDKAAFLPLSGFRDVTGPAKSWVIRQIQDTFEQYGYQPLETPALERQEILLGKLGDEGQKQLYLFEDNGKRKVGLRYDLTVPLGRFVAGNLGTLPLPFKRYEIGSSFRAEKAQKGRFRQFTQADVDIIGAPEPASELELFSIAALISERLDIKMRGFINDRRLIGQLFAALEIPEDKRSEITQLLDRKDKLTDSEFDKQFRSIGLTDVERRNITSYFLGGGNEMLGRIAELIGDGAEVATLRAILGSAEHLGLQVEFSPSLVRGIEYYTGTVFEFFVEDFPRSVAAGGRYDSLLENLTGQKVTAVGLSFGVDNLVDSGAIQLSTDDNLFIVRLPETTNVLNSWVRDLRGRGQKVEVYLDETVELGKQIKYAAKRGYQTILIPFEREWSEGKIVRKNLETGEQQALKREVISND